MPGRNRTPGKIHEMRGTDRARVKKRGEIVLDSGRPNPPTWLLKEAKAEWRRLMKVSRYAAAIEKPDRAMLAIFCQLWARFVESETGPPSIKEFGGRQLQTLISVGAKLGLSPTDRTKIPAAPAKPADDPWARLASS